MECFLSKLFLTPTHFILYSGAHMLLDMPDAFTKCKILLVPSLWFGKRPLHSLSNLCDYYKILEVDYDATDEKIRLNYRKLALKWHPDKHKGDDAVTTKFQEINEAYNVLRDPDKRFDYDITGIYEIDKYTLREYLTRFKGMILTCNGLGIGNTSIW
ncbi:hypothetical protein OIU85_003556 [Salix viminalis]|uniref:J domain-containing protein n=1 Tax=Salix viminalis TaxID=40686 RepID=A0A9Q0T1G9_SALVM|nr:hypothetical protein OIU85_003556 [Salix viminalis]